VLQVSAARASEAEDGCWRAHGLAALIRDIGGRWPEPTCGCISMAVPSTPPRVSICLDRWSECRSAFRRCATILIAARGVFAPGGCGRPGLLLTSATIQRRCRGTLHLERRAACGRPFCAKQGVNVRPRWPPCSRARDSMLRRPNDRHPERSRSLGRFHGLVACAAFRTATVLGAGEGWASRSCSTLGPRGICGILRARPRRSLWRVQRLSNVLGAQELIPGAEAWPRFVRNRSEQYEARLTLVRVPPSQSC